MIVWCWCIEGDVDDVVVYLVCVFVIWLELCDFVFVCDL